MNERRRQGRRETGPGPSSGLEEEGNPIGGNVEVIHGTFRQTLPAGEMPVSEVRRRFRDNLDIHPEAVAHVGGEPVDDSTVLRAGQILMFVRPSGEKGGS